MPRNGSGVFVRGNGSFSGLTVWQDQAASADKTISAPRHDTHDQDIADGLTQSLPRDGQAGMTGDLPVGGNRITSVGNGTTRDDAANLAQVQDGATLWLNTLAGTDAYTATPSPAIPSYVAGQRFSAIVANSNTGNVTLKLGTLDPKPVLTRDLAEVPPDELKATNTYDFFYDGTRFIVNTRIDVTGNQVMTGPLTINALTGQSILNMQQNDVQNGQFKGSGGGLDLEIAASRFLILNAIVQQNGNVTVTGNSTVSGIVNGQAEVQENGERVYSPNNAPSFTSPDTRTPTAGSRQDFSLTGIPFTPTGGGAVLVCLTAELGYAVGDKVYLDSSGDHDNNFGVTTVINAANTTASAIIGTAGIALLNATTFTRSAITPASWRLDFVARH